MRTAHELLDVLTQRTIRLSVHPDAADWRLSRLEVTGNRDALTPDIVADLRRLKTIILAVLLACDCRDCAQRGLRQQSLLVARGYNPHAAHAS